MKPSSALKLIAIASVLASNGRAADLTFGTRTQVSSSNANFNLSVFPGAAAYDDAGVGGVEPGVSTFTNPFGDGTIVDYNFFHSPDNTIASYAKGEDGLISDATCPPENINGGGENWSNVWTAADPAGFTSTQDFTNIDVPNTFARSAEVNGTIDISSLTDGTVYFPHGTFINAWTLTVTMSGPGQTDIVALDTEANGAGTNFGWITEFNFEDAGDFTTLTYNYTNGDRDGSRARFMGVILEGEAVVGGNDTDGDFLLDSWEEENFGNNDGTIDAGELDVSDGTGDADRDGATDRQEQTADSDPNLKDTDDDDLEDGPEINTHGSDPTLTDTDGDTIADGVEVNTHGSDPTLVDTDGDTLNDDEEIVDGADGFVTDPALADTDDDSVRDDIDTEPTDPANDNDMDGLSNADEKNIHLTDPLVADTDGDTILDGEEVIAGVDGFITLPLLADSDGDGFSDSQEVAGGSNPTDGGSIPGSISNVGFIERVQVSSNNANFDISVFPGAASYNDRGIGGAEPGEPTFTNMFGDGTILDYNFIGNEGTGSPLTTYAMGEEGLIPTPTAPSANVHGSGEDWANVWTITDPADFTTLKDHNPGVVGAANTFARCAEVTGTVDISSLGSGTLYFPHGTYINQWTLTVTMSGPGKTDIVALDTQSTNGASTNLGWISSFNFINRDGYDTITYNYTNGDRDGSRARFMGVILESAGGTKGLEITKITYTRLSGPDNVNVNLTFNSREGRTYTILTSEDLSLPIEEWLELDDGFAAAVGADASTFLVDYNASILPLTDKQFFVVKEN
ncbi:MAG: hypothetical protein ACJAQT_000624 [Akkermansiaceae bacterium]|jgi:hypothetical protein